MPMPRPVPLGLVPHGISPSTDGIAERSGSNALPSISLPTITNLMAGTSPTPRANGAGHFSLITTDPNAALVADRGSTKRRPTPQMVLDLEQSNRIAKRDQSARYGWTKRWTSSSALSPLPVDAKVASTSTKRAALESRPADSPFTDRRWHRCVPVQLERRSPS
jgi:hypothetical protein